MTSRGKWGTLWLGWATAFGILETQAIRSGNNDAPLSSHLRWVFGVHRKSRVGKLVFAGFFAWLFNHLWRQG